MMGRLFCCQEQLMSRDLEDIASPEPRITGPNLRKVLEQQRIVRGRAKFPTPDACDELALTLRVFRRNVSFSSTYTEARSRGAEARRRFRAALAELEATIPILRSERLNWIDRLRGNLLLSGIQTETAQDDVALLDNLESMIVQAAERTFEVLEPAFPERWHELVVVLAEAFREAMRSTNPGLHLGHNDRSPLVRFLMFAIPYVTGETPMAGAIAVYLQRQEQR
jgi:hypothetical protein